MGKKKGGGGSSGGRGGPRREGKKGGKGAKSGDYTHDDFLKESWPEFAMNGPHKTVGKLNAEAGRRLQVLLSIMRDYLSDIIG